MAMTVGGSSGIWKALSEANLRLYQYNMERGRILVQGGAALEMDRELKRIDAKYDGKKEAEYEAQIEKVFGQKTALAETKASLDSALKKIDTLRTDLLEMASFAVSGSTEAVDLKLHDINFSVGSSSGSLENLSNLIGNRSRGSWSNKTSIVSANGIDIQLKSQFLGSDYQIITDDGRTLSYDRVTKSVGSYEFANLTVDQSQSTIENGGRIVFNYYNSDTDSYETVEGTLKMGGLKIGNAWMYGLEDSSHYAREISTMQSDVNAIVEETVKANKGAAAQFFKLSETEKNEIIALLDPADAATVQAKMADIATATSDYDAVLVSNREAGKEMAAVIKQAIKELEKAALGFESSSALVNSAMNKFDSQMKDLQRKYDDAAEETFNAKTAARAALKTKMDLLDKKFALTSTTNATLISGLFSYEDADTSKKSIYDILGTDQYSAYKNLMGIS